jgi:hypothetical protein
LTFIGGYAPARVGIAFGRRPPARYANRVLLAAAGLYRLVALRASDGCGERSEGLATANALMD